MHHSTAIIFDFFGVISIRSHQAFFEARIADHHELMHVYELRRQHDLGYITVDEYLAKASRAAGVSSEELLQQLRSERVLNRSLLDLITSELKGNYKIGLLSNAAGDLRSFVPAKLLNGLFDDVLISADVGMVKPNPEIFRLACERLGVTPEQTIMIDDIEENCEGARAAGLQAITYDTFQQCQRQLRELLGP